jgi:uncharacterized surface protein with fasciclin (FAS1) repeats
MLFLTDKILFIFSFSLSVTLDNLLCGDGVTVLSTAQSQFTIFCAALNTPALSQILAILQNTVDSGGVTVFAPHNNAFATFDTTALLANTAMLARLIELHISEAGQVLQTSDLDCNDEICAINTQVDMLGVMPTNCIQQSRTKCTSAGSSFQIGPGNRGGPDGDWPEIGEPMNIFNQIESFTNNPDVMSNLNGLFSSNINVCNGVVHVVDQLLLPGPNNSESKSGKSGKASKGSSPTSQFSDDSNDGKSGKAGKSGRALDQDMINEQDKGNSSHDRRKRLLESLVEPNGNIEQLD